jgi:hypothetical protein
MHVNICYCLEAPYAQPAISITIQFAEKKRQHSAPEVRRLTTPEELVP